MTAAKYPKDAGLVQTITLPNGAAATTNTGFELPQNANGSFTVEHELLLEAPLMATGIMGDSKTMIYSVETDDNSSFSSATVIIPEIMRQTGASGAGVAAKSTRFRLPSNVEKYVRVKATGSTTGDASSKSATVTLFVGGGN